MIQFHIVSCACWTLSWYNLNVESREDFPLESSSPDEVDFPSTGASFTSSLVLRVFCLLCHHSGTVVVLDDALHQLSPTFLAPGTSFMEDNFPWTGGKEEWFWKFKCLTFIVQLIYYYISSTSGHSIRSWMLGTSESKYNAKPTAVDAESKPEWYSRSPLPVFHTILPFNRC